MDKTDLKTTLKLIIYILLTTFILDKVIYITFNLISDKVLSGQAIGKLNHYIITKDTIDVVAFGNSRTNRHINTQKISSSGFNMGVDGTSIAYSATLIKMLPKNKEQIIIVNVDTKNAFKDSYSGDDVNRLNVRYHRDKIIKREIDNVNLDDYIQKFYWSKGYNGKVLGILKNVFMPKYDYRTYYGYDPIYVNETQKQIFQNYLKYSNPEIDCLDSYNMNSLYRYYLNEMKVFCEENKKKLILITAPLYRDSCKEDNAKLIKMLKEMGIEYYDYSDLFVKNNLIQYWKDEIHLSNEGAEIFSDTLQKLLVTNP
ncbi:hypothetical protein ACSTS3_07235 [Aquimarina muelleri]|uniref:hypothetical protein n=1 Tax=Aquimarina muelleri TaxID=279356 RepID=UPI003F684201